MGSIYPVFGPGTGQHLGNATVFRSLQEHCQAVVFVTRRFEGNELVPLSVRQHPQTGAVGHHDLVALMGFQQLFLQIRLAVFPQLGHYLWNTAECQSGRGYRPVHLAAVQIKIKYYPQSG